MTETGTHEFIAQRRSIINGRPASLDFKIFGIEFVGPEIHLSIATEWRVRTSTWANVRRYRLTPTEAFWPGRSFDVVRDGGCSDGSERYAVYLHSDGSDQRCECRAYQAMGVCVHVDLCAWVVRNLIEEPHEHQDVTGPATGPATQGT